MAKKNKETTQLETDVVPSEVAAPVEPKLAIRALASFKDGNLALHFAKLGYGVEWKSMEVRHIPEWLYRLCINSGGRFELA